MAGREMTRAIMASSVDCSMSNGPAIAAPIVISMAITTPPSSYGLTIQLRPRRAIDGTAGVVRVLQVVHHLQHPFENRAHVLVRPGLRLTRHTFNRPRRGKILASQPHIHVDGHLSSRSRSAAVVTGGRHVKSRHTKARA